jgi:ribonuclease HI
MENKRIKGVIRELHEKGRVKLMLIPSHSGITGNERTDEAAKNALEEEINDTVLGPTTTRPN